MNDQGMYHARMMAECNAPFRPFSLLRKLEKTPQLSTENVCGIF